jgi:hypothetical protein
MKKNRLFLVLTMVLIFKSGEVLRAQNLNVKNQDGTISSYGLQDIRNLTFLNTDLIVLLFDGSSFTFSLPSLSNYQYNESTVSIEGLIININDWKLDVYPVPSEKSVSVSFNLESTELIRYTLTDMIGKELLNVDLGQLSSGDNSFLISIENLPQGDYILNIFREGTSYSRKISKN